VLVIYEHELATIITAQTAGGALKHHPYLRGLLADGYWRERGFTGLSVLNLKAVNAQARSVCISWMQ
jgi:hypothetical protein